MINPINSAQSTAVASSLSQRTPAAPKQPANENPQDTVALSPAARGGGDIDHDGDSH